MKALVIYDSMFGNTEQVAQAITAALAEQMEATTQRVGEVTPEALMGVALLIVGSPTQGFQPTPATKELLDRIAVQGLNGVKVAAFDTRVDVADVGNRFLTFMVKIFGYAAKPIANRLEKKGGELVMPPEGFIVNGKEGPLKEGELARAATWAKAVGRMGMPAAESVSVH